ncbi:MAG: VWA domain-containing protein [Termitinemataceae bacterium]|nr:MAG: VWA domain-containing protein [Termitinemataceae bacterium]
MWSKLTLLSVILFAASLPAFSQDLSITQNDLLVTQGSDGGFHLFIRKKPGVSSVLLTETTKDPRLQEDNYAYRSNTWNPVNGNEMRMLNGQFIPQSENIYSLLDSTPERIQEMGEVFHIYIPYIIYYGYENTRHGEVYVGNGTYFNVRSFTRPFADYRGAFRDNPFVLTVDQKPLPGRPVDLYMKDTIAAFSEIADVSGGDTLYSVGPDDIIDTIASVLYRNKGAKLDLVFCIDTTASMKNDLETLRAKLVNMIKEMIPSYRSLRIGFVFYKDYGDSYVTQHFDFTEDMNVVQRTLNYVRAGGGKDIPEAVYEALYDSINKFAWSAPMRKIILIGDAPPHPRQRGKVSRDMVIVGAAQRGISIDTIILPQ